MGGAYLRIDFMENERRSEKSPASLLALMTNLAQPCARRMRSSELHCC